VKINAQRTNINAISHILTNCTRLLQCTTLEIKVVGTVMVNFLSIYLSFIYPIYDNECNPWHGERKRKAQKQIQFGHIKRKENNIYNDWFFLFLLQCHMHFLYLYMLFWILYYGVWEHPVNIQSTGYQLIVNGK